MDINRLKSILSWIRPAKSSQEAEFVNWLEESIKVMGYSPKRDGYGNVWVESEQSTTLFTSHTDTCHSSKLKEYDQELTHDKDLGLITLKDPKPGYVLGADDGTGVFIMLEMLAYGVPGSYVFYRDEEIGGLGSDWSAQNEPERYKQYKRAIAFDRKSDCSVITFQGSSRCCSDTFAAALCEKLNSVGTLSLDLDDGGTFTDTANLTLLVPECTNLSVGYGSQHTCEEYQDVLFLEELVFALRRIDWETLPTERAPYVVEYRSYGRYDYDPAPFPDPESEPLEQEATYILAWGEAYAQKLVYSNPELAAELLYYLASGGEGV